MLTQEGVLGLRNIFKGTHSLIVFPFKWNGVTETITVASPRRQQLWFLILSLYTLNVARSVFEFGYFWGFPNFREQSNSMDPSMSSVIAFHAVCWSSQTVFCIYYWHLYGAKKQILNCFNQLMVLNKIFKDRFGNETELQIILSKKKTYRWTNFAVRYATYWAGNNGAMMLLILFVDRENLCWNWHLMNDWLVAKETLKLLLLGPWILLEAYGVLMIFFVILLYWFIFFTVYIINVNYWLEVLRDSEMDQREKYKIYKALQVLLQFYNALHSPLPWPLYIVVTIFFQVICALSCLKFYLDLVISLFLWSWFLLYCLVEYFFYPGGGKVLRLSEELRREWAFKLSSPREKRIIQSLAPLSVRVGSVFRISPGLPLYMIFVTSNILLNLMLVL